MRWADAAAPPAPGEPPQPGWKYFLRHLDICLTRHLGVHRRLVSVRPRVAGSRAEFWQSLFTSGLLSVEQNGAKPAACTLSVGSHSLAGVVESSDAPFSFADIQPSLDESVATLLAPRDLAAAL